MEDSTEPVDMTGREEFDDRTESSSSFTKIEKKTPSSPREFFEKLYGPDPPDNDIKEQRLSGSFGHETEPASPPDIHTPLSPPPYNPLPHLPPYLSTFPTGGMIPVDSLPLPPGLAAFCKLIDQLTVFL